MHSEGQFLWLCNFKPASSSVAIKNKQEWINGLLTKANILYRNKKNIKCALLYVNILRALFCGLN